MDGCGRWAHIIRMMLVLNREARFLLDMLRLVGSHVVGITRVVQVYRMVTHLMLFLSMIHAEVIVLIERRLTAARTTQMVYVLPVK